MKKTLAIGGPNHGELVEWPIDKWHIAVAVPEFNLATGGVGRAVYYNRHDLIFFGYRCPVWVFETMSNPDSQKFVDNFLPEILSYKGAFLIDSAVARKQ